MPQPGRRPRELERGIPTAREFVAHREHAGVRVGVLRIADRVDARQLSRTLRLGLLAQRAGARDQRLWLEAALARDRNQLALAALRQRG